MIQTLATFGMAFIGLMTLIGISLGTAIAFYVLVNYWMHRKNKG